MQASTTKTAVCITILFIISIASMLLFSAIFLGGWAGLGDFAWAAMFMGGWSKSGCRNWPPMDPSNYTVPRCPEYSNIDFSKWHIPRERLEHISFAPRDPDWLEGPLNGYIFNYDNFTSPTVIVLHGFRNCITHGGIIVASTMCFHAGYNVLVFEMRNHGRSPIYSDQPPMITYGYKEHLDGLGALDYLYAKYPTKFNTQLKPKIGLLGVSMGGAVASILIGREKNFTAAFIDSGLCDVYKTFAHDTTFQNSIGLDFSFVMSSVCFMGKAKYKSKIDCPNPAFPINPMNSLLFNATNGSKQYIHYDHALDDQFVPRWNADMCSQRATESGYIVSRAFVNAPTPQVTTDAPNCYDNHVVSIYDQDAYFQRMKSFFDSTLK